MKTLFRNTLETDAPCVYENYEDAHGSSIQSAVWPLKDLILEKEKTYAKDPEYLLAESEAIEKAAKVLIAAINGEYISKYTKSSK